MMTGEWNGRMPTPAPAPWQKTVSDTALDALIVAAAIMVLASGSPHPNARLVLLAQASRLGLVGLPPRRDVLTELDLWVERLQADPSGQRRALIGSANMVVGGPWAVLVREAAELVGRAAMAPADVLAPPGRAALRRIEAALALPTPPGAAPHAQL